MLTVISRASEFKLGHIMKQQLSLACRLSLGAVLLLLASAWVQVQQLITASPFGRREVIEYGLPFGWLVYDSTIGWRISLSGLTGCFLAILFVVVAFHYISGRLSKAPQRGRVLTLSLLAFLFCIAFFCAMVVFPEHSVP